MAASDQGFRLDRGPGSLGLRCEDTGLSLAGAPLLRASIAGFAPRQNDEIGFLIKAAYGREIDASKLPPRLGEIAGALNRGDLGRAMIAAVHLRLPDLSWAAAVRIARANELLTKYDPDEPRDERGRWTDGAGASGPPGGRLIPVADEEPDLGIGGNRPPPDAEVIPEARPDPRVQVSPGWDVPPQTIGGLYFPGRRNPILPDGTPWPIADRDFVKSVLAHQPGVTPSMVLCTGGRNWTSFGGIDCNGRLSPAAWLRQRDADGDAAKDLFRRERNWARRRQHQSGVGARGDKSFFYNIFQP